MDWYGTDPCPSLNLMCHFTENPYSKSIPMPERERESWRSQYVIGFWPTSSSMVMSVLLCVCVSIRKCVHLPTKIAAISIKSSLKERNFIYILHANEFDVEPALVRFLLSLSFSVSCSFIHCALYLHLYRYFNSLCTYMAENLVGFQKQNKKKHTDETTHKQEKK